MENLLKQAYAINFKRVHDSNLSDHDRENLRIEALKITQKIRDIEKRG